MMKKIYRKEYRFKKKKSIFKNRFFWLTIFILIFLGGGFYLLFLSPLFQIKEIKVSGNQNIPNAKLRELIEPTLEKSIWSFSSRNIFLVNSREIEKETLEKFPQIFEVEIKRKLPNLLIVNIKERTPVAIFLINDQKFFIDREGIIFEEDFKNGINLFQIESLISQNQPKLGERVIPKEIISLILEIEFKLREVLEIFPAEIILVAEERVNVKTSEGFEIFFNLKGDIEWQLAKLQAVLAKEIPPENRKNLEYIDVRFGNLAPYKYQKK